MDIFMLLDRTGSMQGRWDEAVSSVNAYVEQVRDAAGVDLLTDQDRVTLAAFDHFGAGLDLQVLRDGQPMKEWKPLGISEVTPRGNTPLLDAVVRIAAMAEARASEKTVLVVMTDGKENASTECTKQDAKAAIGRLQARGWQVVYLGVQFDAFDQAGQLGIALGQTMSASAGHLRAAMDSTSHSTAAYMKRGMQIKYTVEDRKASGEEDVTGKM
jgi:Mg-chelatase subunit ChlD